MSQIKCPANWVKFVQEHQSQFSKYVCILGTQNSGKSTLCQLFKQVVAHQKSPSFNFEDGKVKQYTLPGIISNNSLQILTASPAVYKIQSKDNQCPSSLIIDTPSYIFPPFNEANKKLWSTPDAKVAFNLLMKSVKEISFVLVVDEKFTRAPMDGTKSIFVNFADSFKILPPSVMQSTLVIITKSPGGLKLDTCLQRIQACIKKLDQNSDKILELFNKMKQKNRFLVFNKLATQEATKNEAKAIYKQVMKLSSYKVCMEDLKTLEFLAEDVKQEIRKYIGGLEKGILKIIDLIIEVADQLIADPQKFQERKNAQSQALFGGGGDKNVKQQILQLPSLLQILTICKSLDAFISKQNQNTFSEILNLLVKEKIIFEGEQVYGPLKQRAEFYKIFYKNIQGIGNWNQGNILKEIINKSSRIRDVRGIVQVVLDSFEEGQTRQFYENISELLKFVDSGNGSEKAKIFQLNLKLKLQIARLLPKAESIEQFIEIHELLLKQKQTDMLGSLLGKIAQILISLNKVGDAVKLFNKCGNPYKGILQMQAVLKDKDLKKKYELKDFIPYIRFLQDIGLFDKSYETCFLLGNYYDLDSERKLFAQFFDKAKSGPTAATIECFVSKKIKFLDKEETNELRKLAIQLSKK